MQKNEISNFLIGLGVGIFLGGVAGILLAPKPGKETREILRNKVKDIKHKIRPTVEQTHRE